MHDESIKNIFSDYFILFKPKDIVSGDFYWFNKINNMSVAICADCTGHGVPGAFMSVLCISLLNPTWHKTTIFLKKINIFDI